MSTDEPGSLGGHGGLDGLNATVNGTEAAANSIMGPRFDFMVLEVKLLLGALGIIYLGAHAALRRPPSASPRKGKKRGQKDDDEDDDRFSQGLELSDAILFPLIAAAMLVGLYYLIQWLKDPTLLNKILRWYMTTMSMASMLTLYAHGLDLSTSVVFPNYWRARDGSLRRVEQRTKSVVVCDQVGNQVDGADAEKNPLPWPLAALACSAQASRAAWELRGLLTRRWLVKFFVHGVAEKANIKFAHVMALLLSLSTALVYFSTTSLFFSNILGYAMCYGSFLVLSPTDFLIGSLVLVGLFFYDIYMVFYTPFMVTVATALEIPIKLTFEQAAQKSILGLGDIVVPGMVIGWALRLDLWLHYLRKIKHESADLTILEKDPSSDEITRRSESKTKEVKACYVSVKGKWGDRLWTRGGTFFSRRPQQLPADLAASAFAKTYFHASMAGYAAGMIATLTMLLVFKQGQPALLYLVPSVLGSLVLTALWRGEMRALWTYTENGRLDTADVVVDLDGEGNAFQTVGELDKGVVDKTEEGKNRQEKGKKTDDDDETSKANGGGGESGGNDPARKKKTKAKRRHQVFLLSLEAPAEVDVVGED